MISSVRKSRLAPIHLADMSPPALCLRRSGIPETRGPLPWKQAPHAAATSEALTCRIVLLNVADVSRSPVSEERSGLLERHRAFFFFGNVLAPT